MKNTLKIAMLSIVFFSCSKEEDNTPQPKSTSASIEGTWKSTNYTSNVPLDHLGSPQTDFFSNQPECVKDNLWIMNSGGGMEINEGATKCDVSAPQSTSANWTLNNNTLTISNDTSQFVGTVIELTDQTLKFTQPGGYIDDSVEVIFTRTMQRQ